MGPRGIIRSRTYQIKEMKKEKEEKTGKNEMSSSICHPRKRKKKSLNHNKGTERGEQGSDLGVKGQASDISAGVEGVDVEQLSM